MYCMPSIVSICSASAELISEARTALTGRRMARSPSV